LLSHRIKSGICGDSSIAAVQALDTQAAVIIQVISQSYETYPRVAGTADAITIVALSFRVLYPPMFG
jgi:hypothetical protein